MSLLILAGQKTVGKLIKARRKSDSGLFVKQAQNEP